MRLLGLLALANMLGPGPALSGLQAQSQAQGGNVQAGATLSIVEVGAIPGETALNTKQIQAAIDRLAHEGGGTVIVPRGLFRSGALFLKPCVNLRLEQGAVLKGSTEVADYPRRRTRIEGQITEWIPALVNAEGCDHVRIDGSGTLDGSGQAFYSRFWEARARNPKTTNLEIERPRLILISDSRDVRVSGLTLLNSGFWNLHLYRCSDSLIEGLRIEAPYGAAPHRGPSTDGIDLDSCQRITVRGCSLAVNDDCICLKGTKGPFAMDDKGSPPTEHIRISDCTFEAGHGALTLGSEASIVRDVVMESCHVTGRMPLMRLKLRRDTPQLYEDVHFRNINLEYSNPCAKDELVEVAAWSQFFDLRGQPTPHTTVRNISLSGLRGHCGAFGEIIGIPGQTEISDIRFEDIEVTLGKETLRVEHAEGIVFKNVRVNGRDCQR